MADEEKYEYKTPVFTLSKSEEIKYLVSLIGRLCKIVHIAEEGAYSPEMFIVGTAFDVQAANAMLDNALVGVYVKLVGIAKEYGNDQVMSLDDLRRQINECKHIINSRLTELGYKRYGRN